MQNATRPPGRAGKRARVVPKLFRVLVAGGIVLAGCPATTKTGEKPDKPGDQAAGSSPSSQPSEPGGVRGW